MRKNQKENSKAANPRKTKAREPQTVPAEFEATGQWPEGSKSYNAGWWNRNSTWVLAKMKTFFKEKQGCYVVNIPINRVVKLGKHVHLSEAFALQLVAQKTSVPVPRLISTFKRGDITYIVMEKIRGKDMDKEWDTMPSADKERLMAELKGYFEQLRKIPHPRPGTVCTAAADAHPLYGFRAPSGRDGNLGAGPFQNETDFNTYLRSGKPSGPLEDLEAMIKIQDSTPPHEIFFTHGDAALRNFMVRKSRSGEFHVVALIDFEMSGFFPEYWEYITSRIPENGVGPEFWNAEIEKFLKLYPLEAKMNQHRLYYFGRFGG